MSKNIHQRWSSVCQRDYPTYIKNKYTKGNIWHIMSYSHRACLGMYRTLCTRGLFPWEVYIIVSIDKSKICKQCLKQYKKKTKTG